jgi:hypothetical protein
MGWLMTETVCPYCDTSTHAGMTQVLMMEAIM